MVTILRAFPPGRTAWVSCLIHWCHIALEMSLKRSKENRGADPSVDIVTLAPASSSSMTGG